MLYLKANALMKANINTLLKARGQSRRDLAQWCRRSDAWIGKIMTVENREFPMKYFDRIADFFGIATYQLLQPGISPLTERRKSGERRQGERRVSHLTGQIRASLSPASANLTEADIADLIRLRMLSAESRAVVRKEIDTLDRSEREAAARGRARRGAGTDATVADSPAVRGQRRAAEN